MSVKVETLRFMCDGENYTELFANSTVANFMHYDAKKHKESKFLYHSGWFSLATHKKL